MSSPRAYLYILLFAFFLAAFFRFKAVGYNLYPHGDIFQEVLVARELPRSHLFTLPYKGVVDSRLAQVTDKVVITDKPPLWPVLISIFSSLFQSDTFLTAKYLSLILGIGALGVFYKLARVFFETEFSFLAMLIVSVNYLMIDFSGNGSRYMLQTFLLLSLLYGLVVKDWGERKRVLVSSSLLAGSVLVNYPMITLLPAVFFAYYLKGVLNLKNVLLSLVVFTLGLLPWIGYNLYHYGTPLLATNLSRIETSLGTYSSETSWFEGKLVSQASIQSKTFVDYLSLIPGFIFPNTVFLAKKMLVILPLLSLFLVTIPFRWRTFLQNKQTVFFFLITFIHVLTFLSWRVLKFRYFVSMYPLFLVSGLLAIRSFRKSVRKYILLATLLGTLLVSIGTYQKNPWHTYYYDGVLTEDQFRQAGEQNYMEKLAKYDSMAELVPKKGVVSTDMTRAYFLENPIYLASPLGMEEQFYEIVNTYQIKYLWLEEALDETTLTKFPEVKLKIQKEGEYLYSIEER